MKPYFYINGTRIIKKFYNKDLTDFKNIREQNYYTSEAEATADLISLEVKLNKIKEMFVK